MFIAKFQNLFYAGKANSPMGQLNIYVDSKPHARKFPTEKELLNELSNGNQDAQKGFLEIEEIKE